MLISIITINLNNSTGLQATIESIRNQSFRNYELLIVDGGSTDGSIEVIKHYSDDITYWISEKDNGIYSAMNKGIIMSKGEYCMFINSGDVLIRSTILGDMITHVNGEDILYGNGYFESKGGKLIKLECPEKLSLKFFTEYCLLHPCTFIKKNLFDKYGLYNEKNRIVSDWEFFIKTIILNNVKTKLIPMEIAIAEDNGISRNIEFKSVLEDEKQTILYRSFHPRVKEFINDYIELNIKYKELQERNSGLILEMNSYKSNKLFRLILKSFRFIIRTHRTIKELRS